MDGGTLNISEDYKTCVYEDTLERINELDEEDVDSMICNILLIQFFEDSDPESELELEITIKDIESGEIMGYGKWPQSSGYFEGYRD